MKPDSFAPLTCPSRLALLRAEPLGLPASRFLEELLIVGGLLTVALVALLDYTTGPYLSLSNFYLLPVVICAWWGGFPHGILLSLAGAVAWYTVGRVENPAMPLFAQAWNGVILFGTMVLVSSLVSRLHAGVLRERLLARTDPLTGAANGRTFYEVAVAEVERARRLRRPLTLAYLDLDNFKQLNDRFGHSTGDEALVHLVRTIHTVVRDYDVLARLGGDEFALMIPEAGGDGASSLLSRLHKQLASDMAVRGWPVSLSVGAITFLEPCADLDLMISWVDALMYEAKRKGKGRVEHFVLERGQKPGQQVGRGAEKRATARVLCGRSARVRPDGREETSEEFAVVHDFSADGVGLILDRSFPCGTLLVIEPLSPGVPALLARVVRVVPEAGKWRHGCELSARLGEDEFSRWHGSSADLDAARS
jgi:diguanylate cyclase (GGDEF)-like protein